MSMNIHISAEREIFIPKINKTDKQVVFFDCWQTPTAVSYEIEQCDNQIQAYKDWVISKSKNEDYEYPVFADDDYFLERGPIGTKICNDGKDHIESLDQWINDLEKDGYVISVEVW